MGKIIFRNYGGSYQISIEKGEDLENIFKLDEAHWAATSVPIEILNCDKKFLEYLDTDRNKRIRTDEVKEGVSYILSLVKDPSIIDGNDELLLSDINTETEKGKLIKQTAEIILKNIGIEDKEKINLSYVRDLQNIMSKAGSNGDGVITPESAEKKDVSEVIKVIMQTIGTKMDASGQPGVDKEIVSTFFLQCQEYIEWAKQGEIPEGKDKTEIMIFGNETPALYNILTRIREKIDQFFILSSLLKFDEKTEQLIKLNEEITGQIDIENKEILVEKLKKMPVAPLNKEMVLYLDKDINILFKKDVEEFKEKLFNKIYPDTDKLTQQQWEEIKNMFLNYKLWFESKKGKKVEAIGKENILKYLSAGYREEIEKIIEKDIQVAPFIQSIKDLEKLILYKKYIIEFLNNFVSFSNVYNPEIISFYEAGVLVIDGRKINMNILVKDINKHKKIASMSNSFIMYLNITGKENNQIQFQIAAPVTSGDSGRIRISKKGIFIDRNGNEWDAEVIDIVKNPVGLLEAVKAPFIKIGDNIKVQIEKITAAKQKKAEQALVSPSSASFARDLMVGGGVAVAAIGSSFAYITKVLSQIKITHILMTIGIIGALILIPSLIIGLLKLSRRDLSILFEASGCAINVKMRLGTKLGRILTYIPDFPENSKRLKLDVLSKFIKLQKRSKRFKVLIGILAILLIIFFFYFFYKHY